MYVKYLEGCIYYALNTAVYHVVWPSVHLHVAYIGLPTIFHDIM